MEVINVLKTGQDTNDLYSQNNISTSCNFENRDQIPLDINSINLALIEIFEIELKS